MVEIYLGVVTHWAFWVVLIGCGAFYGIQKQFEVPKLKALHQRPIDALRDYYVVVVFAVGGLVLAGAYWMYLHDIIWSVHAMVGRLRELADAPTGENIAETLNNLAQGSALLLGALVAAATLIFTLLRTWINERTTRATEEGLITDRINAAVASLGAVKTVKGIEDGKEYTHPNIEVRVGAILALERIAKRSLDVHIQIMEILCAYIRENTKEKRERPREDIQLALTVIGRRSEKAITMEPWGLIDLRGTHLDHADLREARLPNAQLTGAQLNEANLYGAELNRAYLIAAQLNGADLIKAQLNEAYLSWAQLNGANLSEAQLNGANLSEAQLNGAEYLTEAELRGVLVADLDFTDVTITREKLHEMFGDASVILPDALQPAPTHWPTVVLGLGDAFPEWKRWLEDPDGYVFDPTRYGDKYTDQTGE